MAANSRSWLKSVAAISGTYTSCIFTWRNIPADEFCPVTAIHSCSQGLIPCNLTFFIRDFLIFSAHTMIFQVLLLLIFI